MTTNLKVPFTSHRSQLIFALISGLLLALAFPKPDQGWLAWIALVPLILALRKASPRQGFKLGFGFGLAAHLGIIYWTVHAMHVYGYVPLFQSIFVLILFCAVLSVFSGLFGFLLVLLGRRPWHLLFLSPPIWVALEFSRTWLFTGFPWALLGYSQANHRWVIQIADLFGVYGVSALVVCINVVVALAMLMWIEKTWHFQVVSKTVVKRSAALMGVLLVLVVTYGIYRIHATNTKSARSAKASLVVIQGNVNQAQKWDPSFQVLTTAKYKNMSLAASQNSVDLIIWPETATPFYLFNNPLLTSMVVEGIKETRTAHLIGSPSVESAGDEDAEPAFLNSAYLVTPWGEAAGRYDKVHLVPFGEYVPLKRLLWFVDKLVAQVGDFKRGRPGRNLEWEQFRIGTLICYEAIFPTLARAMVQNGANILINITNDAWFGNTGAPYQQFAMAAFRAVENRRFLARAANTGISGFIDANGRPMGTTALFQEASLGAQVALLEDKTLYCRWGDWPLALMCFGLLLAVGLRLRLKKTK
jgi:apolipoprotein N-acyltransferase